GHLEDAASDSRREAAPSLIQREKRQLLHVYVTPLRQPCGNGRLANDPLIGEVLARGRNVPDVVGLLEIELELRTRPCFANLAEILEERSEQCPRAFREVSVDGVEGKLYALLGLLLVEQVDVDRREQRRVQLDRLRDDLAVGQQTGTDHLDCRERARRVQDPEGRVIQVA